MVKQKFPALMEETRWTSWIFPKEVLVMESPCWSQRKDLGRKEWQRGPLVEGP